MITKQSTTLTLVFAAAACGSDTGRHRVDFEMSVAGLFSSETPNDHGYTVQLTEARLSAERIAFFEGDPLFSLRSPLRQWRDGLADLLIAPAYAHPGHYTPGGVMADLEVREQFDLLSATPRTWGTAAGVSGMYGSVELDLGGPGPVVVLKGTATGPAGDVDFDLSVEGAHQIAGIAMNLEVNRDVDGVRLVVDLNAILDRIDFGQLPSANGDGAQPQNGLIRGVTATDSYRLDSTDTE